MHRPRVTQRTINCPYLGLRDDSLTSHSFPSDRNYCHYTRTPIPIEPSYQTIYCLSEYHVNRPIFTGAEAPAEAETKRGLPLLLRRGCIFTAVAAAILLISFFLPCFAGSSGMWLGVLPLGRPTAQPVTVSLPTQEAPAPTEPLPPTDTILPDATDTAVAETECVIPAGWNAYILNPGDNLVQLSGSAGLTLFELQRGNCGIDLAKVTMGSMIFLPEILTPTPSMTLTFTPTPTPSPTLALPTATGTPTPTITPTYTPAVTPTRLPPGAGPRPTSTRPKPHKPPPPPPPVTRGAIFQ